MNEQVLRIEEEITNLMTCTETILYNGWILKIVADYMIIYPLYSKSMDNMLERVQTCEQIGKTKGVTCIFRIVQYTNYCLKSCLSDYDYKDCRRAIIGSLDLLNDYMNNMKESDVPLCKVSFEKNDSSIGTDRNYISESECVYISDDKQIKEIGVKQGNQLFINDGLVLNKEELISVIKFAKDKEIRIISVEIPEQENLPVIYEQTGFQKIYMYTCYQKEDVENGFTE